MDHIDLKSIDADGAIAETHAAAQEAIDSGHTRSGFLRKGALAGGAAMSGGAILGALLPGTALAATKGAPPASFGKGDIGILNYALTLEYLESSFYNAATKNNIAKGDKVLTAFLKTATKDENAHVKFLKAGLKSAASRSRSSTSARPSPTRRRLPRRHTSWRTPASTPISARLATSPTRPTCWRLRRS